MLKTIKNLSSILFILCVLCPVVSYADCVDPPVEEQCILFDPIGIRFYETREDRVKAYVKIQPISNIQLGVDSFYIEIKCGDYVLYSKHIVGSDFDVNCKTAVFRDDDVKLKIKKTQRSGVVQYGISFKGKQAEIDRPIDTLIKTFIQIGNDTFSVERDWRERPTSFILLDNLRECE